MRYNCLSQVSRVALCLSILKYLRTNPVHCNLVLWLPGICLEKGMHCPIYELLPVIVIHTVGHKKATLCKENNLRWMLIAQPDDLCYCSLAIGVDHLYFTTQMTEKYSTAMCYNKPRLGALFSAFQDKLGEGESNIWCVSKIFINIDFSLSASPPSPLNFNPNHHSL